MLSKRSFLTTYHIFHDFCSNKPLPLCHLPQLLQLIRSLNSVVCLSVFALFFFLNYKNSSWFLTLFREPTFLFSSPSRTLFELSSALCFPPPLYCSMAKPLKATCTQSQGDNFSVDFRIFFFFLKWVFISCNFHLKIVLSRPWQEVFLRGMEAFPCFIC